MELMDEQRQSPTGQWLEKNVQHTIIAPIQGAEGYMESAEDKRKWAATTGDDDAINGRVRRGETPPRRRGGAVQDEQDALKKLDAAQRKLSEEKGKIKREPGRRRGLFG